ncbi:MAG: carboxypeptidase regulatory-like domain-containing protein, partial [Acidobacteriota bacterium]|nr:carboxypeptidase regulatory-like domain-containing protein [Acidobacteriota bacterium]
MEQFSLCKISKNYETKGFQQRHDDCPINESMKAEKRNAKTSQLHKTLQNFYFIRLMLLLGAGLTLGFTSNVFAADAGTIKGTVQAVSAAATGGAAANTQTTLIAGARLTLVNKATPNQPLKTVSDESGAFIFSNLPSGNYTLTIEADGLGSVSRDIALTSGATLNLDVDLTATVSETVTIRAEEGLLSTSETVTSNVVRAETLKNEPFRDDNFKNSIALTPGVVTDGSGNNYLKGTRVGQSSYTVNGADVTDPSTGKLAFEIPLEAVNSVEIEENPYSAEFGRFTGGVTNVETKGGADKFKFSAARLFPTFRNVFSTKVDSFRPRVTFSGPLIKKRLYFLQSFEYRFRRDLVTSQPKPGNQITTEGFTSFTQIDLNINKTNSLKFNAAIFPQRLRNVNLDTFNPAATTPNYKQRGMLFSVTEQSVFSDASFLSSEINYKTFDVDVFAKSTLPFNVAPETNYGGYFADTRRKTSRLQLREVYFSRPLTFHGEHSLKVGVEFNRNNVSGLFNFSPIFIRRIDNTLAQKVDFINPANRVQTKYNEFTFFAQDRFVASKKITLEYGIRYDRDSIAKQNNFAPRFSFLFTPFKNQKTIFRGGAGIFYDKTLASAGYFADTNAVQFPERIITNFAPDGTTLTAPPTRFFNQIAGDLKNPRSVRYNFQVDQGITENLVARVGFLQRFTTQDLLIQPVITGANTGALQLSSTGKSRYTELQFILNYRKPKFLDLTGSYVFSRSRGDLNSADRLTGDYPSFVVRPNE